MELGIPDTKMTFLAFLTIAVALLSLLGRETRTWLRKANSRQELAARLGGLAAGTTGSLAALVLLEGERGVELLLLASLAAGGAIYVLGVMLWRGRAALALRAVGWSLAVAALAVPSILSLALPATALLIVTLGPAPEHEPGSRPQPARG